MLTQIQQINLLVAEARKTWLKHTVAQELELYQMFTDAALRLIVAINEATIEGIIPPRRMTSLLSEIKQTMDQMRPKMRRYLSKEQAKAIDAGIEANIIGLAPVLSTKYKVQIGTSFLDPAGKLHKYNATVEAYDTSIWARLHQTAIDFMVRYAPGGIPLSSRIWDVSWQAEKALRHRLNIAVVLGEKASTVAKDIQKYLGTPKAFIPANLTDLEVMSAGRGIYASPYANALRVARTELTRAYVEGGRQYNNSKPWIQGVIHRTSGIEPCEECADLEGTFYPRGEDSGIPIHPHCMCYEEPSLDETVLAEE
jgi:hypothetical protein